MREMRTPLSRVRGLGSAKTGTRDFWIQRLTAAANVPLALFLVASLVALTGADYATVRSYLGQSMGGEPDAAARPFRNMAYANRCRSSSKTTFI